MDVSRRAASVRHARARASRNVACSRSREASRARLRAIRPSFSNILFPPRNSRRCATDPSTDTFSGGRAKRERFRLVECGGFLTVDRRPPPYQFLHVPNGSARASPSGRTVAVYARSATGSIVRVRVRVRVRFAFANSRIPRVTTVRVRPWYGTRTRYIRSYRHRRKEPSFAERIVTAAMERRTLIVATFRRIVQRLHTCKECFTRVCVRTRFFLRERYHRFGNVRDFARYETFSRTIIPYAINDYARSIPIGNTR